MKRNTLTKIFYPLLILTIITSQLALPQKALAGQPYVGEIKLVGFNFAPAGWAFCDGRLLSIAEYDTLFTIIGTTYGGDGQTTFALPDLRGRVPVHSGTGPNLPTVVAGEMFGNETVTQLSSQMAGHNHAAAVSSNPGTTVSPINAIPAAAQTPDGQPVLAYTTNAPTGIAASNAIGITGGNQPQDNRQPFLGLNYVISLYGVYPTPN